MPNLDSFEEKLKSSVEPNLSAKELAERLVVAALESEFGKSFTLTPGFAKMVNTIADAVVTNPDLRRQTLSVASDYIKINRDNQQKNISQGN